MANRGTMKAVYSETPQASGSLQPKTPPLTSMTIWRRPFFTLIAVLTASVATVRSAVVAVAGSVMTALTRIVAAPSAEPESNDTELSLGTLSATGLPIEPRPLCDHSQTTVAPAGSFSLITPAIAMLLSVGRSAGPGGVMRRLNSGLTLAVAWALAIRRRVTAPVSALVTDSYTSTLMFSFSPPLVPSASR